MEPGRFFNKSFSKLTRSAKEVTLCPVTKNMPNTKTLSSLCGLFLVTIFAALTASAQSSAFTYQGKLTSGGTDGAGAFDFKFRLYDLASGGAQQGAELVRDDVAVSAGVFSVTLDFGNQFAAAGERWLEIEVRDGASNGAYTLLSPRQRISSSPFSVQTINAQFAVTAGNAQAVGGIPAANIVNTSDPRLTDARPPTAGSGNYVQNTASQQPASNFNISGNGTAGGTLSGQNVNATFEYRLGGQAFLRSVGTNMSFGIESGAANLGLSNTYSGYRAGQSATSNASNNSFFGARAGRVNSSGTDNSFFGNNSGELNSTGGFNAFFGSNSGAANSVGSRNAFFGVTAGRDNTLGSDNTFVGGAAGQGNQTGNNNSFFGSVAGTGTTTGSNNSFFGRAAGNVNVSGTFNTAIGDGANFGSGNLSFATAIGSGAIASANNTVVLGRPADNVQIPGTLAVTGAISGTATNATQLGGIAANQYVTTTAGNASYIQNTTSPQAASNFNISGTGNANIINAETEYRFAGQTVLRTNEFGNTISIGKNAGHAGTGSGNTFIGGQAGQNTSTGSNNVFIGTGAGGGNNGSGNVAVGTYNVWPIVPSNNNSYFGFLSGQFSTGNSNSFFGTDSGTGNETGSANSAFGRGTRFLSGGLTNASAFGALAAVGQNNSIVLGSINGVNGAAANTSVGIGTTAPSFRFHVKADGQDGIKIQHTGTGAFPQLRFTDSNDAFKASIGVDTSNTGNMNFFVNGADRIILKSNGVVQVPGAIFINNPNTLIITSPNGACWGITVNNSGVLSTFPVNPCP